MSCFGGQMKEYDKVSLDRFDGKNLQSSVYFLSHLHEDHTRGLGEPIFFKRLKSNSDVFLYCSEVTEILLRASKKYKHLKPYIKSLPINTPTQIPIPDPLFDQCQQSVVTVTLLPAFHCPGSVMFLLEGGEGTVLYTGDFRWEHFHLEQMHQLRSGESVKSIKSLYIDTTFCTTETLHIPSRQQCIEAVYQLIHEWTVQSPSHVVYIQLRAQYGHEPLLNAVAAALGKKVHVNATKYGVYRSIIELSENFTDDGINTQIHACDKTCMVEVGGEMVQCRTRHDPCNVLVILPTTMYFTQFQYLTLDRIVKCVGENFYRACYSFHSSYTEVKDLISYLKPERVFPNVKPPSDASLAETQRRLNAMLKECRAGREGSRDTSAAADDTRKLGTLKTGRGRQKRKNRDSISETESLDFGTPVKQSRIQAASLDSSGGGVTRGGHQEAESQPVGGATRRSSRRLVAAAASGDSASQTQTTTPKKGRRSKAQRSPTPDMFMSTPVKRETSETSDMQSSYSGSHHDDSEMDLSLLSQRSVGSAGGECAGWTAGSFLAAVSSSSLEEEGRVCVVDDEEQTDGQFVDESQLGEENTTVDNSDLSLDDIEQMSSPVQKQKDPVSPITPSNTRSRGRSRGRGKARGSGGRKSTGRKAKTQTSSELEDTSVSIVTDTVQTGNLSMDSAQTNIDSVKDKNGLLNSDNKPCADVTNDIEESKELSSLSSPTTCAIQSDQSKTDAKTDVVDLFSRTEVVKANDTKGASDKPDHLAMITETSKKTTHSTDNKLISPVIPVKEIKTSEKISRYKKLFRRSKESDIKNDQAGIKDVTGKNMKASNTNFPSDMDQASDRDSTDIKAESSDTQTPIRENPSKTTDSKNIKADSESVDGTMSMETQDCILNLSSDSLSMEEAIGKAIMENEKSQDLFEYTPIVDMNIEAAKPDPQELSVEVKIDTGKVCDSVGNDCVKSVSKSKSEKGDSEEFVLRLSCDTDGEDNGGRISGDPGKAHTSVKCDDSVTKASGMGEKVDIVVVLDDSDSEQSDENSGTRNNTRSADHIQNDEQTDSDMQGLNLDIVIGEDTDTNSSPEMSQSIFTNEQSSTRTFKKTSTKLKKKDKSELENVREQKLDKCEESTSKKPGDDVNDDNKAEQTNTNMSKDKLEKNSPSVSNEVNCDSVNDKSAKGYDNKKIVLDEIFDSDSKIMDITTDKVTKDGTVGKEEGNENIELVSDLESGSKVVDLANDQATEEDKNDDVYEVVDLTGDDFGVDLDLEQEKRNVKKKINISFGKSKEQIMREKERREMRKRIEKINEGDSDEESDTRTAVKPAEWLSTASGSRPKKHSVSKHVSAVNALQKIEDELLEIDKSLQISTETTQPTVDKEKEEREEMKRQAMGFVCETDSESDEDSSEPASPTGSLLYDDYIELSSGDEGDKRDRGGAGASGRGMSSQRGRDGGSSGGQGGERDTTRDSGGQWLSARGSRCRERPTDEENSTQETGTDPFVIPGFDIDTDTNDNISEKVGSEHISTEPINNKEHTSDSNSGNQGVIHKEHAAGTTNDNIQIETIVELQATAEKDTEEGKISVGDANLDTDIVISGKDTPTPSNGITMPNKEITTPEKENPTSSESMITSEKGIPIPDKEITTPEKGNIAAYKDITTPEGNNHTTNKDISTQEKEEIRKVNHTLSQVKPNLDIPLDESQPAPPGIDEVVLPGLEVKEKGKQISVSEEQIRDKELIVIEIDDSSDQIKDDENKPEELKKTNDPVLADFHNKFFSFKERPCPSILNKQDKGFVPNSRSRRRSRSRSRSRSPYRSKYNSRRRRSGHYRSRSRSRGRLRSRSRGRSRSRSGSQSMDWYITRSRSRSRSKDRYRSRSGSRGRYEAWDREIGRERRDSYGGSEHGKASPRHSRSYRSRRDSSRSGNDDVSGFSMEPTEKPQRIVTVIPHTSRTVRISPKDQNKTPSNFAPFGSQQYLVQNPTPYQQQYQQQQQQQQQQHQQQYQQQQQQAHQQQVHPASTFSGTQYTYPMSQQQPPTNFSYAPQGLGYNSRSAQNNNKISEQYNQFVESISGDRVGPNNSQSLSAHNLAFSANNFNFCYENKPPQGFVNTLTQKPSKLKHQLFPSAQSMQSDLAMQQHQVNLPLALPPVRDISALKASILTAVGLATTTEATSVALDNQSVETPYASQSTFTNTTSLCMAPLPSAFVAEPPKPTETLSELVQQLEGVKSQLKQAEQVQSRQSRPVPPTEPYPDRRINEHGPYNTEYMDRSYDDRRDPYLRPREHVPLHPAHDRDPYRRDPYSRRDHDTNRRDPLPDPYYDDQYHDHREPRRPPPNGLYSRHEDPGYDDYPHRLPPDHEDYYERDIHAREYRDRPPADRVHDPYLHRAPADRFNEMAYPDPTRARPLDPYYDSEPTYDEPLTHIRDRPPHPAGQGYHGNQARFPPPNSRSKPQALLDIQGLGPDRSNATQVVAKQTKIRTTVLSRSGKILSQTAGVAIQGSKEAN